MKTAEKTIRSPEDLRSLHVGQTVWLKAWNQPFMIVNTSEVFTDTGPVENPVTLVTVDFEGRPHTIIVSAYCLIMKD